MPMHEVRDDSRDHGERGDAYAECNGQLVRLETFLLYSCGL